MLNVLLGDGSRRASRRSLLKVGALTVGGVTLADALRAQAAEAQQANPTRKRAVICFWLDGGPPQHETFDPKPDAPSEFRGPYESIPTALPGVFYSEWFPRLAGIADKLNLIRSVHHSTADHYAGCHWMWTGYFGATFADLAAKYPCIGSIVAKTLGPNRPGLPAFVSIPQAITNNLKPGFQSASFLGSEYNAFDPGGNPAASDFKVQNLHLPDGIGTDRLSDRAQLLGSLDRVRRDLDQSGAMEGIDKFHAQAMELVTGSNAQTAFDIQREPTQLRDRYGRNQIGQSALLARRLVEAGVTFVTVNSIPGAFDHHQNLHKRMIVYSQPFDAAIATLIEDLIERGLYDDVFVLVMGEFGRTPKINANGGRDHWGGVFPVLMAGGGLKSGQVVGSSDGKGAVPVDRPISPADILATMYRQIGVDPTHVNHDRLGRPVPILSDGNVIDELM